jgi:hypothetical protein
VTGKDTSDPSSRNEDLARAAGLNRIDAKLEDDPQAEDHAREFLIAVAEGSSGLDLDGLRTVRDCAWR